MSKFDATTNTGVKPDHAAPETESRQAAKPLIKLDHVNTWFEVKSHKFWAPKKYVKAVNDVSLEIFPGETLGVVGESGCGKTTLGRTIIKLEQQKSGKIYFDGLDTSTLNEEQTKQFRRDISIIFQDPYESLNPRMTVGEIISEPLQIEKKLNQRDQLKRTIELMRLTGLDPIYIQRYPHEFSGGQRQRIGIARALATMPKVMICDEPVSALDVSIQSQILNLLLDIQTKLDVAYLFISHDLSVIKHMSDRIAVMYLGKIVELGTADAFDRVYLHPYTELLMGSVLDIGSRHESAEKVRIKGDIPSPVDLPSGCVFHTRCPYCQELCKQQAPELRSFTPDHAVACHFSEKIHGLTTHDENL